MALRPADRLALGALEATLLQHAISTMSGQRLRCSRGRWSSSACGRFPRRDLSDWSRVTATHGCGACRAPGRSDSAVSAYRIAIDDLLAWAQREGRGGDLFDDRGSWTTSMTTGGDAIRRRRPTTGILCCCATSCNGSAAAREPRTPIRCSAGWRVGTCKRTS